MRDRVMNFSNYYVPNVTEVSAYTTCTAAC
jgi:hypothetical protein